MVTASDFSEHALEGMTAGIYVHPSMYSILGQSNVGLGTCGIQEGEHRYTYAEAASIIHQIDRLLPSAPKYLQKRIRATRMGFVLAFGPEMEAKFPA